MATAVMEGHGAWGAAMKIELQFEGGKDDDPIDPGGRTNQGVIQRVYSSWRKKNNLPVRDVFLMENDERDRIYYENYGRAVRFDDLPPGVNVVVLDGGVNSGPAQSIKWLQRALGLGADGVLGDRTLEAVINHPDHDKLIASILDQRERFLRALKTFYHFGKGWMARVNQLRKIGQAWAMGSVGPAIAWVPNMNKKATIVDAKKKLSTAPADATAAGGVVSSTISTVQSTLEPLSYTSETVNQVLIGIMVLGAIATAVGFAYAYYVRNHNRALEEDLGIATRVAIGANDNAIVPAEVLEQYADPLARGGSETGNIGMNTVTTSGRTAGDAEERVNAPSPVPESKAA
jgi:lysozyme family protein